MAMSPNIKDREHDKFVETADGNTSVRVDLSSGSLGSLLQGVSWDYVIETEPTSTQEIYTFKSGGASGTITAVIEITYKTASKQSIDFVLRST
jgi:hypothetical protein